MTLEASGPDGRPGLTRGGKSELRRAVCRITSGIPASRLEDGQCHRKHTALRLGGVVRVKGCGKSAPPEQQCSGHGKPHTEQDQIGRESASADTHRLGASEPSGRSHERGSNAGPRGMIIIPACPGYRIRLTGPLAFLVIGAIHLGHNKSKSGPRHRNEATIECMVVIYGSLPSPRHENRNRAGRRAALLVQANAPQ
jgi:hypothetical protein